MAKIEEKSIIEKNIKDWHIPMPEQDYMVVVQCSTYNHEKYIEDALKGFVMQKTNFPWCVLVTDDCSTDGTATIVKKYADKYPAIIKPILLGYNHMQHQIDRGPYIIPWHNRGKYIALCEGDDYWTDQLKLQKQVDFMEEHEEYSMCFHFVKVDSDKNEDVLAFDHLTERDYLAEDFYGRWAISTCSILYRRSLYNRVYTPSLNVVYGDMYMFLLLSEVGKIRCLGFVGSVYRRHSNGMSNIVSHERLCKLSKQYRWYTKRFGYNGKLKQLSIQQENDYLSLVINDISYKDTWKYRFRYMFLNPKLFFSKFLLVTVVEYILCRPYFIKKKENTRTI